MLDALSPDALRHGFEAESETDLTTGLYEVQYAGPEAGFLHVLQAQLLTISSTHSQSNKVIVPVPTIHTPCCRSPDGVRNPAEGTSIFRRTCIWLQPGYRIDQSEHGKVQLPITMTVVECTDRDIFCKSPHALTDRAVCMMQFRDRVACSGCRRLQHA